MIRLLSLNCWKDEGNWTARIAAIAAGLTELQPDIICLQEVYTGGGRDTGQSLAITTGLVCAAVTARHKNRSGVHSSSGVAILSRWPAEDILAFDLPTTPADGGRKALICTFATAVGAVRVASLHLSHLRTQDAGRLRAAQLACIIEHASAGWAGPLVLAGDFNAPWHAPELAALRGPDWTSTATALAGRTSRLDHTGALIDHIALHAPQSAPAWILADTALVLDQRAANGVMPSDHAGVMTRLTH